MNLMFLCKMNDYWEKVLKKLEGTNVCLTHMTVLEKQEFDFKGVKMLKMKDFADPKFYERENRKSPYALSKELIMDLQECENIFLSVSDRLGFFSISVRKRKLIYYDMLLYWYTFFRDNEIDCFMYSATPHMGWDIILYYMAKKFEIRTFNMERTCINDALLFVEDYTKIEKVPEDYLKGATKDKIIDIVGKDYYEGVIKNNHCADLLEQIISKKKTSQKFLNRTQRMFELIGASLKIHKYSTRQIQSAFFYNSDFWLRNDVFMLIHFIKYLRDRKLYRYYQKLSREVNYEDKYIFFPLQFQPERTSMPLGGVFENQILALEILAKSIPQGWKIFVREHPRQLKIPRMNSIHYRNKDYYDKIQSIPHVLIVGLEVDIKKLIKNAHIIATLTGTIGWEGMVEGKQCIVFGYPWYLGSNNCYSVDSVETCKTAIEHIVQKETSETELDFLKYLAYYKKRFFVTTNYHSFAVKSEKNYDLLVDNLAEAIIATVNEEVKYKINRKEFSFNG